MTELHCPICGEPLDSMDLGGLSADYCSAHGVWLSEAGYEALMRRAGSERRKDLQSRIREARAIGYEEGRVSRYERRRRVRRRRERERQTERPPPPPPPPNVEGEKPCPVCGAALTTETWSDFFKATPDVTVDGCPDHGLWFDLGELDVLVMRAELDAERESEGKVRRARAQGYRKGRESTES